jgi:hypothetical protein
MTYAMAWPLQEAIYTVLCDNAVCAQFFGHRVFDGPVPFPAEAEPEGLYLTIGDEQVRDWSTATDDGAEHVVLLTVHAPRRGFGDAKQAAAAVFQALIDGPYTISRGRIVNVRFLESRTRRQENDALREIEMRFRYVLEDTD